MAERSLHTDNQMCSWYRSRSLEQNFPDLIPFLYGGADVLDVGCGPGTVTAGVAQMVTPGIATGVDTQRELIEIAVTGRLQSGIENLRFEVADASALPFPSDTFDVTYSRDLFHFLPNPVAALKEQLRVTRPTGKVVAFAVDWGTLVSYPDLPAVQEVVAAWRNYPNEPGLPVFVDPHVGSKLFAYMRSAGAQSVAVQGVYQRDYCLTAGSSEFDQWWPRLTMHFDADRFAAPMYGRLFDRGLLDRAALCRATDELERWHEHPDAFMAVGYFLASGSRCSTMRMSAPLYNAEGRSSVAQQNVRNMAGDSIFGYEGDGDHVSQV